MSDAFGTAVIDAAVRIMASQLRGAEIDLSLPHLCTEVLVARGWSLSVIDDLLDAARRRASEPEETP
jgi:hypothetical protein